MGPRSSKLRRSCSSVSSLTEISPVGGVENPTYNDAYDYYKTKGFSKQIVKLQLILTAEGLRSSHFSAKRNHMAVVFERTSEGELKELGRTEVKKKSCNPVWLHPVSIFYEPDAIQRELVFHVYEVDNNYVDLPVNTLKLDEQTLVGEIEQQYLQNIITKLGGLGRVWKLPLLRDAQEHTGRTLNVLVEDTVAPSQAFEIVFRCSKLDNKDTFSKSDPFLQISRLNKQNNYVAIHETEVVKNNLNPIWKRASLNLQNLRSKDTRLLIQCRDFNSSGNHKLIGEFHTSVADLERLYKDKLGGKFLLSSRDAQIFVDSFTEYKLYCFSDFLKNKFQLEFIFAIGFTASGGDPSHQLDTFPQVISQVGESIGFFDFDKSFPAWGFGGDVESQVFNLDSSAGDTEVEAIDGILSAYSQARAKIALGSPASARFGEVIRKAVKYSLSQSSCGPPKYSCLIIISAGILADTNETRNALREASKCPLSIIIIGVDGVDCEQMQMLEAEHDIVQFVPWRELEGEKDSSAEQLFSKLPGRFLEYMGREGIKPEV